MMLLDNDKLAELEDEFNEYPGGIELTNFVWLMKCAIMHSEEEKYELINGLIKLFEDIDINGDQQMEWSEFTQYIIDAVIGEKDQNTLEARFEKERDLTEKEIIDRAYSKKTKKYQECNYKDNSNHLGLIIKAIYSPHLDAILTLEQNSSKIKFYTTDCKEVEIQQKKIQLQPNFEDQQRPFILDFTIAESLNTIVIITSNRQFFLWENNLTTKPIKNFVVDVLQTGIWYLPIQKLWISAGADYNIRTWNFDQYPDQTKIKQERLMLAHLKMITKIEELNSPRLIASSSLDGKIKLWDLTDSSHPPILVTELRDPNQTFRGVLGLSYSSFYGSNLLSYGFQNHINIWCPELSITRPFIGKLEGHSHLVQNCKFMEKSPNIISIDEKCNVRIWDIRTSKSIQIINLEGQFSTIYDICVVFDQKDMFILTGKRLIYFENLQFSGLKNNISNEQYPICVDFNYYFKTFAILTKNDMRIYNAMNGKLQKVFNELYDDNFQVDLSMFVSGARQRKFFVADNLGLIRQYNMKNGSFLKNVNKKDETESQEFTKKKTSEIPKKEENNQISQIIFLMEEKLLIASFFDSTIRIYDEEDASESVLIRILKGGHRDSEITSLAYSDKHSLITSGSANGMIAVWEFQTGLLETIFICKEKGEVNSLIFADDFPVLFSSGSSGIVYLWGLKKCPADFKYACIGRFVNSYFSKDNYIPVGISYIICESNVQKGVDFEIIEDDIAPHQKQEFNPVINDQKDRNKDSSNIQNNYEQQNTTIRKQNLSFQDYQEAYNQYKNTIYENKKRIYLIIGDHKGRMQTWNFSEYFQQKGLKEVEKKKIIFKLKKRKDLINGQKAVDFILQTPERKNEKFPNIVHCYNSVLIKRWEAHINQINFILKINNPILYASCSLDQQIKIWDIQGKCFARICLGNPNKNFWDFPFDWVQHKLKDTDEVFNQLDGINRLDQENSNKLSVKQKEQIQKKYLKTQYFQNNTKEKIKEIKYETLYPKHELTKDQIKEQQKKELYTYIRQIKYVQDPIQDLKNKIYEEKQLDDIQNKKNEIIKKCGTAEQDIIPIKQFYNYIPKVEDFNNNLPLTNSDFEEIKRKFIQSKKQQDHKKQEIKKKINKKNLKVFFKQIIFNLLNNIFKLENLSDKVQLNRKSQSLKKINDQKQKLPLENKLLQSSLFKQTYNIPIKEKILNNNFISKSANEKIQQKLNNIFFLLFKKKEEENIHIIKIQNIYKEKLKDYQKHQLINMYFNRILKLP
ncbi:hypothetical protein IMG5_143010 [Ichthyophthirius multifiliis]|uniref:EF-hand domain-containing protein n=1 Tax=Ichthyophthirius multifiliis TaxID=5932 RepID=G0QXI1_ICHMU|nr:hypothetical protein IMG5_143010 [Ichthyophthirius multifiliis]EGR30073.1 hypothetical protein IMG5_143010 [Ichthyophthirius multifiliis]|eukprot:XP_004031309.1 hypothetical protein IMG5_143010 [Ichthyophthirius multifiliis]